MLWATRSGPGSAEKKLALVFASDYPEMEG